ncbi:MAG: esterase, partial [Bradyrhizobium sp.]
MLKQDIVREATRLTRTGQLVEATVLLQRMLRGESAPDPTSRTTVRIALTGREPPMIDAKANTIEETDRPPLARATSAQPRRFRAFLDRTKEHSGLGLRGVIKRAPL